MPMINRTGKFAYSDANGNAAGYLLPLDVLPREMLMYTGLPTIAYSVSSRELRKELYGYTNSEVMGWNEPRAYIHKDGRVEQSNIVRVEKGSYKMPVLLFTSELKDLNFTMGKKLGFGLFGLWFGTRVFDATIFISAGLEHFESGILVAAGDVEKDVVGVEVVGEANKITGTLFVKAEVGVWDSINKRF